MIINEDTLLLIKKFLAWFLPSSLAVSAKLAFQSSVQKLSIQKVLASLIMACFVGYIADSLCTNYGLTTLRGVIVSISALGSESLIAFFFKNDSKIIKNLLLRIFNIDLDKNKKNDSIS